MKVDPEGTMGTIRNILQEIVLRRRKDDVIKEKLNLPDRMVDHAELTFTSREESIYRAVETASQDEFRKIVRTERDMNENYIHILVIINRMRQACCHPLLVTWSKKKKKPKNDDSDSDLDESDDDDDDVEGREISTFSFHSKEVISRLLENICSICLVDDEEIEKQMTTPCGHKFCEACITAWLGKKNTCPVCIFYFTFFLLPFLFFNSLFFNSNSIVIQLSPKMNLFLWLKF